MGRTAESNDRWGVCASAGSRIDRGWAEPRRRVAESSREGSSRRRDRRGPEGGDGRRARRSRGRDALAYYLVAGSTMPLSDRRRERRCGQRDIRFAWMGPGDDERRGGRGEGRCKTRSMVWFDGSQD
ncbi:hypothetical protein VFPBJ_02720 [Purpureocillium lilacinum]|uniref:Uncharacterized protein n=1 Tax=Purpureocillium lilacinum TaxID=33203 RepID=A0A179H3A4_PURLI|nr:hypothetical protein VFPBJ_02720 [Purpureocillium lilacinum]